MFGKNKNKEVHNLIMEQVNDVENTLIQFETFLRAASVPETPHETLITLKNGVSAAEKKADISLRRMIDSLYSGFLPSTRKDFIDIATACDAIANKCESSVVKIVNQHFRFPQEDIDDINKIIELTHKQYSVLSKSISLLFSKFGELLQDHSILDEVRDYESQIDKIEQKLLAETFDKSGELAEKIQLYNFIEWVCDLSDIIENIADKIQIMLITRKA